MSGQRLEPESDPAPLNSNDLGTDGYRHRYHRGGGHQSAAQSPDRRALRDAARATGRSQQELIREAVERYLVVGSNSGERDRLIAAGIVRPATPFPDVEPWLALPAGTTSLELLIVTTTVDGDLRRHLGPAEKSDLRTTSAIEVGASSMLTYDDRLADAAALIGLAVVRPPG
jgi:hypothetical protein